MTAGITAKETAEWQLEEQLGGRLNGSWKNSLGDGKMAAGRTALGTAEFQLEEQL